MAQFKVGDKVRVKYKDKDNEGVIVCIQYNGDKIVYCSIRCLEPYYVSTGIENIELIPPLKTADEMLLELGWKKGICTKWVERYEHTEYDGSSLVFYISEKEYYCNTVLNLAEHKAITKKLEELGWL